MENKGWQNIFKGTPNFRCHDSEAAPVDAPIQPRNVNVVVTRVSRDYSVTRLRLTGDALI